MGTNGKRELIISASTRVFPRLGYHRATVEDILKEANVARSTFYAYFSSKRELFIAVIKGLTAEILQTIGAGVDSLIERMRQGGALVRDDSMVEDALTQLMRQGFGLIEQSRGMAKVFLHELVGIDDEMTALFLDFQNGLVDNFEKLIAFGEETGFIRDVDQRRAADFVVGGLIHLGRNYSAGIEQYDIDEVCREYVEMELRGLLIRDEEDSRQTDVGVT